MDFKLSEELTLRRAMAHEFAAEQIAPNADQWDGAH